LKRQGYIQRRPVIELAVVRIEPNEKPHLVLDTLINPSRRVAATEIHGITDRDVADAPHFEEIAGNVASAISGSVFASYNVYFDIKFLQEELSRVGIPRNCPTCV
jgi:DNA polymerase III epsilon subunit-like protein